jgi:hypothetical protein
MTGILIPPMVLRAVDASGVPMSGAQLQFYLTGTLTPSAVFTSSTLATPLPNPVVSDSAGLFPPMFRDPTVTYRAQLLTSGGSLVQDVDPVAAPTQIAGGSIVATMLAAGTAVTNIGYIPVNRGGDTAVNLALAFTSLSTTSAGYLGAPRNQQDGAYTLALSDAGGMVRHNSASPFAHTIPPVATIAFPIGTAIVFRNYGAGVLTITRGSGVSLTIAGSGASKDVAMAQYGFATAIMEDINVWVIAGTGLS